MWAACRLGEFTYSSISSHIQPIYTFDCSRHPSMMRIFLKKSKTDQTLEGVALFVGHTNTDLCPVVGMLAYLAIRPSQDPCAPPFLLRDGQPLTRPFLVAWLKDTVSKTGMNASYFFGHSLRIGAATNAAMRGVSDGTIQTLGRWRSDSYAR